MDTSEPPPHHLLAVDVGARCGMALYSADGRLVWHRAQAFGDAQAMRRTVREILEGNGGPDGGITWLITQGDISLAAVWERVAMREGIRVQRVSSEAWQGRLLAAADRRTGTGARRAASSLARAVIAASGAPAPAARVVESASAILIGLWGAMSLGWPVRTPGRAPRRPAAAAAAG